MGLRGRLLHALCGTRDVERMEEEQEHGNIKTWMWKLEQPLDILESVPTMIY